MKCSQPSLFRYTWPGKDEDYVCIEHAKQLKSIAEAMGFHIQLIILEGIELVDNKPCSQEIKEEEKD